MSSLNLLITSTVWRQDHNGFTHQDPGFLDLVVNKSPDVCRIYLPPDANTLLSVANHCLKSTGYINVIVSDKQKHLQYMTMDEAIAHCTKGISIWRKVSNDEGSEPDVVMACAGDIPTKEALAAVVLLREHFPNLKIRFVNVVDLYRLVPSTEHPHGLSDRDFDSLFTKDKPIIFNFHGYPWLIHRLTYRRTNHKNLHVRGYKEKGNINTPLDLAIQNQIDRFSLAIDVIDRVPALQVAGAHAKEILRNMQIDCQNYAYEHGVDKPELDQWTWPGLKQVRRVARRRIVSMAAKTMPADISDSGAIFITGGYWLRQRCTPFREDRTRKTRPRRQAHPRKEYSYEYKRASFQSTKTKRHKAEGRNSKAIRVWPHSVHGRGRAL